MHSRLEYGSTGSFSTHKRVWVLSAPLQRHDQRYYTLTVIFSQAKHTESVFLIVEVYGGKKNTLSVKLFKF